MIKGILRASSSKGGSVMFKRGVAVLLILLLLGTSGCKRSSPSVPTKKSNVDTPSDQLLAYFPKSTGTVWEYDGMAEYGCRMTLMSQRSQEEPPRTIYRLEGEVADMSDGESTANFHFELKYHFTQDSVYEEILESGSPFPHRIPYLKMLTLPLKKGNRWEQEVTVNGQSQSLTAEIITIGSEKVFEKDIQTLTVRYRVPMANMPGGIYEEVRVFAKGYGILRFENTFGPNKTDRFNYFLRAMHQSSEDNVQ